MCKVKTEQKTELKLHNNGGREGETSRMKLHHEKLNDDQNALLPMSCQAAKSSTAIGRAAHVTTCKAVTGES